MRSMSGSPEWVGAAGVCLRGAKLSRGGGACCWEEEAAPVVGGGGGSGVAGSGAWTAGPSVMGVSAIVGEGCGVGVEAAGRGEG
jgi:hypothetical protein